MLTLIHKIVGGCMLFALLTVVFLWQSEARQKRKFQAQAVELSATLQRISTEKAEQKTVTTRNIAKAREDQQTVKVIVKRIREAPNPKDCGTPALEEARNVL